MFRLEDKILELTFKKYVLKFRNNYLNKVIKSKCEDLYKARRDLQRELKELRERLLTESDSKSIIEIQKRIMEISYELKEIENEIKKRASFELEIKNKIKEEIRKTDKELKKKISAIINEREDIIEPIEQSIANKQPDLSLVIVYNYNKAMRVDKPEPVLLVSSSSNSSKVPGDGTGGAGVRVL